MTEFLRKNKLAAAGLFIVAALTMAALFAPWLAPYDPADQKLMDRLQGPSWKHPFGNDELGRDIRSRILWGARVSMRVGATVVFLSGLAGVLIGGFAERRREAGHACYGGGHQFVVGLPRSPVCDRACGFPGPGSRSINFCADDDRLGRICPAGARSGPQSKDTRVRGISPRAWGVEHKDLRRPHFAQHRPAGFGAGQRWNGDCHTQRSIAKFSRLGYSPANAESGCYVE